MDCDDSSLSSDRATHRLNDFPDSPPSAKEERAMSKRIGRESP
jgi:hypothetical protein